MVYYCCVWRWKEEVVGRAHDSSEVKVLVAKEPDIKNYLTVGENEDSIFNFRGRSLHEETFDKYGSDVGLALKLIIRWFIKIDGGGGAVSGSPVRLHMHWAATSLKLAFEMAKYMQSRRQVASVSRNNTKWLTARFGDDASEDGNGVIALNEIRNLGIRTVNAFVMLMVPLSLALPISRIWLLHHA
ncbi:hypothetical protein CSAL01_08693 [Colletotrichum salicis]|uniref:Uncharacterized protein n=1 Tax=Colletotrichum salicis TaxID=1209931 RepID=A0A135T2M3_9PEZI|nr:hypothetical protein CSAL01_08693 [Colletotrichum salicis]